jgi:hypothetical protein
VRLFSRPRLTGYPVDDAHRCTVREEATDDGPSDSLGAAGDDDATTPAVRLAPPSLHHPIGGTMAAVYHVALAGRLRPTRMSPLCTEANVRSIQTSPAWGAITIWRTRFSGSTT